MARQTMKIKKFNLEDSDMISENERILAQKKEDGVVIPSNKVMRSEDVKTAKNEDSAFGAAVSSATNEVPDGKKTEDMPSANVADGMRGGPDFRSSRVRKTENGITVYVPMEYYERIVLMKMRTGVPIKDIALKAVIEYVDRHRND